MIAKLAYLTSPAPDRFLLNIQATDPIGHETLLQIEISRAHLANIIIDGASFSLRENSIHRGFPISQTESAE